MATTTINNNKISRFRVRVHVRTCQFGVLFQISLVYINLRRKRFPVAYFPVECTISAFYEIYIYIFHSNLPLCLLYLVCLLCLLPLCSNTEQCEAAARPIRRLRIRTPQHPTSYRLASFLMRTISFPKAPNLPNPLTFFYRESMTHIALLLLLLSRALPHPLHPERPTSLLAAQRRTLIQG